MRGILQKNWAVLFNTVNFMTDKEAEEPSRLKCTKETWQLSIWCDMDVVRWGENAMKDISQIMTEFENELWNS